jgi:hypothetical protein
MKRDDEKNGRYYQAVSRFFLEHRGPPFYLSSKEIEEIKEWKNMGIPLQIVLEGIKDCFVSRRRKPGRKGKIVSLVFCRSFVLRGHEAYKERKVGSQRKPFRAEGKKKELQKAVEGFLASCPEKFTDLRRVFLRVLESISCGIDEEILEDLENDAEALLIGMASEKEKKQIQKEVLSEFGTKDPRESDRIQKLKLIKHIRKKFGIPHISLYYY